MYIGSTDSKGLHHLAYEIIDNAVDEALDGYGNEIIVKIYNDDSLSVEDYGRGIPTGIHDTGRPTTEVIFTVLHAGGKFGQGGYKASGGLHGVGAAVVNALSEWFEVTTYRDGKVYQQSFHNGGVPATELKFIENTRRTGTKIHFKPDETIFSVTDFKYETLAERLREAAFLFSDLKITFEDERHDVIETYEYEDGLNSYIDYLNEGKQTLRSEEHTSE